MKNLKFKNIRNTYHVFMILSMIVTLTSIMSCEKDDELNEDTMEISVEEKEDILTEKDSDNYDSMMDNIGENFSKDASNLRSRVVFYEKEKFEGGRYHLIKTESSIRMKIGSSRVNNFKSMVIPPNHSIDLLDKDRKSIVKFKTQDTPRYLYAIAPYIITRARYYTYKDLRPVSKQEKTFLAYIYDHKNYKGKSLPIYESPVPLDLRKIRGWENTPISSINMRSGNYDGELYLRDPSKPSFTGIYLDNSDNASDLGHLSERRNLRIYGPQTTVYKLKGQRGKELLDFVDTIKSEKVSNPIPVTKHELAVMCQKVVTECEKVNGDVEVWALGIDAACAGFITLITSDLKAVKFLKNWGRFTRGVSGAGKEAGESFVQLFNKKPGVVTANGVKWGGAGVGCSAALYATAKIPYLQDCKTEQTSCLTTEFYGKVKCTNC